jgi:hypothetical protein
VAARSNVYARGRWPANVVDSNLVGGRVVFVLCFVLPHIGLCDELIARLEESYRLWCIVVCDLETPDLGFP